MVSPKRVKLTEIFYSIQGESRTVGIPTVFVRFTGCPLRCQYCDTTDAFRGGHWYDFDAIVSRVQQYSTRYVTVTGGEPLAQPVCADLLIQLCDLGYHVSLETSGALDIAHIDTRVMKVMDIKTPGSLESTRNRYENIAHLTAHDAVKFVICDRADYDWAKSMVAQHALTQRCEVLFSPEHGRCDKQALADWIIADGLPVRFQLQLHKQIWGDVSGR